MSRIPTPLLPPGSFRAPALVRMGYFFALALCGAPLSAEEPVKATERPPVASSSSTVAQTTSMEVLNDAIKLGVGDRVSFRVVEDRR